ncbi:hypothetical protein A4X13_0g8500 [Tilletia indica]|uniref:Uncharacterized protein n=1 Tax=Tilletia indica TaxID=43049 RepID=A0A177T2W8_9BASI|nr:hypothetical protein A4X13_0g8500 [Tilletia indica]
MRARRVELVIGGSTSSKGAKMGSGDSAIGPHRFGRLAMVSADATRVLRSVSLPTTNIGIIKHSLVRAPWDGTTNSTLVQQRVGLAPLVHQVNHTGMGDYGGHGQWCIAQR